MHVVFGQWGRDVVVVGEGRFVGHSVPGDEACGCVSAWCREVSHECTEVDVDGRSVWSSEFFVGDAPPFVGPGQRVVRVSVDEAREIVSKVGPICERKEGSWAQFRASVFG